MKASYIKTGFLKTLSYMQDNLSSFVKHPGIDFTRNRKCSFSDVILCLLTFQNNSLNRELRRFFPKPEQIPSKSAFSQQREKLSDEAFPSLFSELNRAFPLKKTFRGYHLLACDGSDVNIPPARDPSTFVRSNTKEVGYYQLHLNALYDLLEERYLNILLQPRSEVNERTAILSFLSQLSDSSKSLLIADRGFFSLNVLAHLQQSGHGFLLRLNSEETKTSFLRRFSLPDSSEFDIQLHFAATRSKKKQYLQDPSRYVILRRDRSFTLISDSDKDSVFEFHVRLLKIDLPSGPEYLLTNLPEKNFSMSVVKELYHMRWGIETSFRSLKYNVLLNCFHAIRRDFIIQEIYARIILYNLTLLLVKNVSQPPPTKKYCRKISVSDAVVTCRELLLGKISGVMAEKMLLRYITEIRPDRSFPRKVRAKRYISFNNRA